ncbi:tetratricopeptide repeat-containing sensor histidine kinase [Nocardioides sp.]|uniref:tetratricopeptide repeat-containing sensor histidine kinase n=1 Tax=Nocardioides sp. TaxID=35761 RepID=UPI002CAC06AE|nr:tetratricopeptide repeat-containing sensor histidine kinase [Nocardioides sp.]HXH77432.1 tetratricopeptide repeat-containing sensor histidine kinase [Nocardioides sp.]
MTERAVPSLGGRPDSEAFPDAEGPIADLARKLDVLELSTTQFAVDCDDPAELAAELERQAEQLGAEHLRRRAMLVQADVQCRQGQPISAGRLLRSVNRWAIEHEDQYLLARSHRLLGTFFGSLGDDVAFLENAMAGVELLSPEAGPDLRCDHLRSLGVAQGRVGAFDEGRRSFAEAEELADRLGNRERQVFIVNNLAYLEYQAGEHQRGLETVDRLLQLAETHSVALASRYLDTIARVYLEVGRFSEAEDVLQELLDRIEVNDFANMDGKAEGFLTLAEVKRRGGSLDEAHAALERCREWCDRLSLYGVMVRVRKEQAELYAAEGRMAEAFTEFKRFYRESQQLTSEARMAHSRTLQTVYDLEQIQRTSQLVEEVAAAKGDFIAMVSHELRTPLTSIIGYLDLLDDVKDPIPEEALRYLSAVTRNADRLLVLVTELLAASEVANSPMRLTLAPTDLSALVNHCIDDLGQRAIEAGLTVVRDLPPDVVINADAGRLTQVVDNLLSNAIKFTPAGGQISVRVLCQDQGVDLIVRDTGIGIDAASLPHLTTKFFRTPQASAAAIPGVGLGLMITNSVVEAHHGTLSVTSREHEGTSVRVHLPKGSLPGTPTVQPLGLNGRAAL